MCNRKTVKVFPAPTAKAKKVKNPAAYYQCLMTESQRGLAGRPITQVCRNCKLNSVSLAHNRNQQISNLLNAYRQIGEALRKFAGLCKNAVGNQGTGITGAINEK
ncbi:15032_t:CDS:2, partial [Racocetra persica]